MTLSRPSTTLSPSAAIPRARGWCSCRRCAPSGRSPSGQLGGAWISTPLPRNTMPRVMMCGFGSLNFSSRQYRTRYHGVYARLAAPTSATPGSGSWPDVDPSSRDPRQRCAAAHPTWSSWPESLPELDPRLPSPVLPATLQEPKGSRVPAIIALAATALITGARPVAETPTPGSTRARPPVARSVRDAANSSYSPTAGAERCAWSGPVRSRATGARRRSAPAATGGQLPRPPAAARSWSGRPTTRPVSAGAPGWCRAAASAARCSTASTSLRRSAGNDHLVSADPVDPVAEPVIGMPTHAQNAVAGNLLVVPHLGQVLVFDAHRGAVVGTSLDLVAGVDPPRPRGLADCRAARPGMPRRGGARLSEGHRNRRGDVWEPGADRPGLVGLRYRPGQNTAQPRVDQRSRRRRGAREPGGCPRTERRCRSTAATSDCGGCNAADGKPKWSASLGDSSAQTPPSVTPAGWFSPAAGRERG